MSSKGTAHRMTKKHHRLNVEHSLKHKGDLPITLGSLKRVAVGVQIITEGNTYYCGKCKHSHKIDSQVGRQHKV